MASRGLGVQMSMRLPRTDRPVSATTYSPLYWPAATWTRVPRGNTETSAAISPRMGRLPLAVRPPRLYAVATYVEGRVTGGFKESALAVSELVGALASLTTPLVAPDEVGS